MVARDRAKLISASIGTVTAMLLSPNAPLARAAEPNHVYVGPASGSTAWSTTTNWDTGTVPGDTGHLGHTVALTPSSSSATALTLQFPVAGPDTSVPAGTPAAYAIGSLTLSAVDPIQPINIGDNAATNNASLKFNSQGANNA